jgi:hypothetical protein
MTTIPLRLDFDHQLKAVGRGSDGKGGGSSEPFCLTTGSATAEIRGNVAESAPIMPTRPVLLPPRIELRTVKGMC